MSRWFCVFFLCFPRFSPIFYRFSPVFYRFPLISILPRPAAVLFTALASYNSLPCGINWNKPWHRKGTLWNHQNRKSCCGPLLFLICFPPFCCWRSLFFFTGWSWRRRRLTLQYTWSIRWYASSAGFWQEKASAAGVSSGGCCPVFFIFLYCTQCHGSWAEARPRSCPGPWPWWPAASQAAHWAACSADKDKGLKKGYFWSRPDLFRNTLLYLYISGFSLSFILWRLFPFLFL